MKKHEYVKIPTCYRILFNLMSAEQAGMLVKELLSYNAGNPIEYSMEDYFRKECPEPVTFIFHSLQEEQDMQED